MSNKFGIDKIIKDFEAKKKTLPKIIGNEAKNFFVENFRKQGFDDSTIEKWKKRRNDKTKRQKGRAILVKSGRLRRSIKLKHVSWNRILISTDVPYAQVHNEGSRKVVYVRPHKRTANGKRTNVSGYAYRQNIPKRQFIGDSKRLNSLITNTIYHEIDQIFK